MYDQEGRSILTSFLRSADKQCHLRETETVLKDAEKYDELTVFYRTRGLHKKALKMLKKLFDKTVNGVDNYGSVRTVAYLTRMEDKDIHLLLKSLTIGIIWQRLVTVWDIVSEVQEETRLKNSS